MDDKELKKIQDAVRKWADYVETEIKDLLERSQVRASGRLIDSISIDVDRTENGVVRLAFQGTEYAIYVLKGRSPGKQPPLFKIREWARLKGIDEKLAFPIARKIGMEGIKPFNFLAPFYKHLGDLKDVVSKTYTEEFRGDVIVLLQDLKLK